MLPVKPQHGFAGESCWDILFLTQFVVFFPLAFKNIKLSQKPAWFAFSPLQGASWKSIMLPAHKPASDLVIIENLSRTQREKKHRKQEVHSLGHSLCALTAARGHNQLLHLHHEISSIAARGSCRAAVDTPDSGHFPAMEISDPLKNGDHVAVPSLAVSKARLGGAWSHLG